MSGMTPKQGFAGDSESRCALLRCSECRNRQPLRETPHPNLPQSGEGAFCHTELDSKFTQRKSLLIFIIYRFINLFNFFC